MCRCKILPPSWRSHAISWCCPHTGIKHEYVLTEGSLYFEFVDPTSLSALIF
jgi:hypothetical protein